MSGRIFQSVVLQLREGTDRAIGVIDGQGTVVACNELSDIGARWSDAAELIAASGTGIVACNGRMFKPLSGWTSHFDYAVFTQGTDSDARLICSMAAVALNGAKAQYESKYDKATFIKNIISDNILQSDIFGRAKELHFAIDQPRAALLVRLNDGDAGAAWETISTLLPDRQTDFVFPVDDADIAVIRQLQDPTDAKESSLLAKQIEATLAADGETSCLIGIGTMARSLQELGRSYKEARIAIEVGRVFETEKTIIHYEHLGIGRLIYQLPTTLCGMFLQEVFKRNPIDALDSETLFTINKFFENNLNVSETARKLFVHRNTLVYRLEKIKKLTGLDLREFDDAITFKVALMVKKYLSSRPEK